MGFESQLIELVRKRICLYQTKSRSNTNNKERINEWHRVSTALGKPVNECRQRWRSLRDRFVREKKKIELGEILNNEQQWEYYKDLEFLIPSVKPRRSRREKVKKQGANIYLKREHSDHFASVSNSRDESLMTESHQCHSYNEKFDAETATSLEFNGESKEREADEEFISDDNGDYVEEKFFVEKDESQYLKEEEWIEDDFDKYPIIKIPSNENQCSTPLINRTRQSETKTTTTNPASDPNSVFVELMTTLQSEIRKVLVNEKDENDLFLECMGKKMKKLSSRAKFKIQAKLLESITEELLKEDQE